MSSNLLLFLPRSPPSPEPFFARDPPTVQEASRPLLVVPAAVTFLASPAGPDKLHFGFCPRAATTLVRITNDAEPAPSSGETNVRMREISLAVSHRNTRAHTHSRSLLPPTPSSHFRYIPIWRPVSVYLSVRLQCHRCVIEGGGDMCSQAGNHTPLNTHKQAVQFILFIKATD